MEIAGNRNVFRPTGRRSLGRRISAAPKRERAAAVIGEYFYRHFRTDVNSRAYFFHPTDVGFPNTVMRSR